MPPTPDTQFEQTMADLAFSTIQDKAPSLLDYLVGFQVLDVNDDQTQAAGVFGCKLHNQWVYLPVFFTNGELKGTELMYLKEQDLFVPLQENWIVYLMQRKPHHLGSTSQYTNKDLEGGGINTLPLRGSPLSLGKSAADALAKAIASNHKTDPSFYRTVSREKRSSHQIPCWAASDIQPWTSDFVRTMRSRSFDKLAKDLDIRTALSELVKIAIERQPDMDLIKFARTAGPRALKTLVRNMLTKSAFGTNVLRYYKPEAITSVTKFTGQEIEKQAGDTHQRIRMPDGSIVRGEQLKIANDISVRILAAGDLDGWSFRHGLSDKEKGDLKRGKIVIQDHRTNTSQVYNADVPRSVQAIDSTGVYEYVSCDGTLVKALAIVNPVDISGGGGIQAYTTYPSYHPLQNKRIVLVNLEGPGIDLFTHAVYAKELPQWVSLTNTSDAFIDQDKMVEGGRYCLVTQRGSGTNGFYVLHKRAPVDGGPTSLFVVPDLNPSDFILERGVNYGACFEIVLTGKPGGITHVHDTLFAGTNALAVKPNIPEIDNNEGCSSVCWSGYDLPKPATLDQIDRMIWGDGSLSALKIYSTGTEYNVTFGPGETKSASMVTRRQALESLVREHGIRGTTAVELLKKADANAARRESLRVSVQYAKGYPMIKAAAGAGLGTPPRTYSDPSVRAPVSSWEQESVPVQEMAADASNASVYDTTPGIDEDIQQTVQNAAQTGQKEVFDTAIVGGLVKAVETDDLVDKFLSDMILGMDRIGRIYFLFLQHNENFADRYGQEDLIELEDSLRSTFKGVGDLILFLKERTVDASASTDRTRNDMTV